jgi:peptide/nickel transport system permease protein
MALVGPALAPESPNHVDLSAVLSSPSGAHLLGTDSSGRDLLSRIMFGARSALAGPLIVCVLATALGTLVGTVAAWLGGLADTVAVRGLDVIFAFPGLLAAILAVAMFGKGLVAPAIALSIVYVPYVGRVVRSAAIRERSLPYVAALTVQGFSAPRILFRHLLLNISPVVVVQAVVTFSYAMIDLAAINFLGLGLQPPSSDWGVMIANGQSAILGGHPQESISAALCFVAVIVSANVLGDRVATRAGTV